MRTPLDSMRTAITTYRRTEEHLHVVNLEKVPPKHMVQAEDAGTRHITKRTARIPRNTSRVRARIPRKSQVNGVQMDVCVIECVWMWLIVVMVMMVAAITTLWRSLVEPMG